MNLFYIKASAPQLMKQPCDSCKTLAQFIRVVARARKLRIRHCMVSRAWFIRGLAGMVFRQGVMEKRGE
jgi:hypothetical protein